MTGEIYSVHPQLYIRLEIIHVPSKKCLKNHFKAVFVFISLFSEQMTISMFSA